MTPSSRTRALVVAAAVLGASAFGLVTACEDAKPEARAPRVVSLTPAGTRALGVLGLSRSIVAADEASQALLSGGVPLARLSDALDHRPDVVLVTPTEPDDRAGIESIRMRGPAVIEIAPHQLTEALALYEELGLVLGDAPLGHRTANRIGDPFAAASARQLGRTRPRVAVVVDLDPLTLAGGHSFETDLVEIAGGESITHGGEEPRVERALTDVHSAEPELVIVSTAEALTDRQRAGAVAAFAPLLVRFTVLDPDALWLEDARETVDAWTTMLETARPRPPASTAPGR